MTPPLPLLILAQADGERSDFFRRWAQSMRDSSGSAVLFVGVVLMLVGAFFFLRWLAGRHDTGRGRPKDSPMAVFRGLIERHRLQRGEARVLEAVAAARRLSDPGVLFVRPTLFDRYMEQYVRQIDQDDQRRRVDKEVAELRVRLFGYLDAGAETLAADASNHQPLVD